MEGQPELGLGVVVVHGIGGQLQGQTLRTWTDALAARTKASVSSARLHPSADEPAHAYIEHRGDRAQTWLVAEAWWQGELSIPSYGQLAGWMFKALPAMLFGHVISIAIRFGHERPIETGTERLRAIVFVGLLLGVGMPLALAWAPVLLLLTAALLVLGLLPIASVRSAVLRMQRALTGAVGDAMLLIDSKTYAAAMTSRVTSALEFLQRRGCSRIAVVAHSQGAAIAVEALGADRGPAVNTLVTIGSGVNKMNQLEQLKVGSRRDTWVSLIALAFMIWTSLLLIRDVPTEVTSIAQLGVLAIVLIVGTIVFVAVRDETFHQLRRRRVGRTGGATVQPEPTAPARDLDAHDANISVAVQGTALVSLCLLLWLLVPGQLSAYAWTYAVFALIGVHLHAVSLQSLGWPASKPDPYQKVTQWIDIYAQYDPVPNGPTRTASSLSAPLNIRVHNLDSALSDHTFYMRADDDALAAIALALYNTAEDPSPPYRRSPQMRREAGRRRWRVKCLLCVRWLVALAVLVGIAANASALDELGRWEYNATSRLLPGNLSSLHGDELTHLLPVLGAVTFALAGFIAYAGLYLLWRTWRPLDASLSLVESPEGSSAVEQEEVDARSKTRRFVFVLAAACSGLVMLAIRAQHASAAVRRDTRFELGVAALPWVIAALALALVVLWLVFASGLYKRLSTAPET